jgi:DNA repair ATPase RecN
MDYNKIVSVSGLSGLFELLSSKSDGAVVRSIEDNSTRFVSTRQHNFSHLESIEVFTKKDNTSLAEIFEAMKESEEKLPEAKADNKVLKSYFEKVYPDMDFERVYTSDMKKMIKWYDIINKNKIEIKVRTEEETEAAADQKSKPAHVENAHLKEMRPQQANPRKIESRGVK